jgi:hypothetical protein
MTAAGSGSIAPPEPRILSASWGTDNAVGCPSGEQGLDNIPVTFTWFIRRTSIQTTDFRVVRSDGSTATPTCALQFPPDESDEAQTVNLIGDFGDSASGPTPVAIRVVGALHGRAPGANRWRQFPPLPRASVEPLSGGPYIVEVGAPVVASYRATYKLPNGKLVAAAPLDVADLDDHASSANADNMHDLCLPQPPRGAKLTGVRIGGGLIQDPNGDPNVAQKFRASRPG